MILGFDAKRAFWNKSGLGNYSRSLIRMVHDHLPVSDLLLYTPAINPEVRFPQECRIRTPRKRLHRAFPSYWRSKGILQDMKEDTPRIYHGLSNELPAGISQSPVRSVVTIHDLIFLRYPAYYKAADRWIYKRKFRNSCGEADRIVAISKQTRDDLVSFFDIRPENISVIYQGCNPAFYEQAPERSKVEVKTKYGLPDEFLLYVGTIEPRKNLLGLVTALHSGKINTPLVAVGKQTAYFNEVKEYCSRHSIESVQFIPFIRNEELPALYQLASVFVYPSFFEGFGIPILEALNSGTPVVTSRGGCFSETGGEAALYATPEEPGDIAEKIRAFLKDEELRNEKIAEGYCHAARFREEKLAADWKKLYESLL